MKFFLLTTVLAAAGVAAEEEITFLHEGSHVQCNGPVHNDCPSSRIAYTCENGLACCKWDHLGRMNRAQRDALGEDINLPNGFGHCSRNGPTAASKDDEDWAPEEWADEDELPEFLSEEGNNKCQCNGNGDCGSGKYCHKTNCSPSEAEDEDEDEEEEELPGFLRGISIIEEGNNKCGCNSNGDCGSGKYCKSSNCNSHNGKKYGHCKEKNKNLYKNGVCKSNKHKSGKNCNYKQCQHKDNSSKCKCSNNQRCVKGHNSCTTSGDNNGCCVSDFEGVAGLYVQDDEDFEGTE